MTASSTSWGSMGLWRGLCQRGLSRRGQSYWPTASTKRSVDHISYSHLLICGVRRSAVQGVRPRSRSFLKNDTALTRSLSSWMRDSPASRRIMAPRWLHWAWLRRAVSMWTSRSRRLAGTPALLLLIPAVCSAPPFIAMMSC